MKRQVIITLAFLSVFLTAWMMITGLVNIWAQEVGDVTVYVPGYGPGSVVLVRDGAVVGDYGTGQNAAERGANLVSAMAAAAAGDILYTGTGEYAVEDLTLDDAITWIAQGTICIPTGDGAFQSIVKVEADDVTIRGVTCDGQHQANTSTGNGFWIANGADRTQILDCRAVNMNGNTTTNGRGIIVAGVNNDVLIDGYYSEDCKYIGILAANANRLTIRNATIYNSGATNGATGAGQNNPRSIEIQGSSGTQLEFVHLENIYCLSTTSKGQAYIGWNTGVGTEVKHAVMDNVRVVNKDNISSGVSYDIAARMQTVKFQNILSLHVTNCRFVHGENQNAGGTAYAFSFDTAPVSSYFENIACSGGYAGNLGSRFEHLTFRNCQFGIDDVNESTLINGVPVGKVKYENCTFDLGTTATITWAINATAAAAGDSFVVLDSRFLSNNSSNTNVINDTDLTSQPRRTVVAGNSYANSGTGSFVLSTDADIYLLLSTDRNGNLMYDASDGSMPAPGAGPTNFFTTVPGVEDGQRIINEEYNGSGTKYWTYNGTNWIVGDS